MSSPPINVQSQLSLYLCCGATHPEDVLTADLLSVSVTKKEYETCSGSESEETPVKNGADEKEKPKSAPASASVEPPKPSKPKEATQPKVKQAGIMSFFKKK